MIRSFGDKATEAVWREVRSRTFPPDILQTAFRKLEMLHAANSLQDLRTPQANRLEALKGKLKGRHSIRINDQWRVCFRWRDGGAEDVEIIDYH